MDWREKFARALYAVRFPCAPHDEHIAWYLAGKDNPESCVRYSTVAEAFRDADTVIRCIEEQGCAILPEEPTDEMMARGASRWNAFASVGNRLCNAYRAMYAARPR